MIRNIIRYVGLALVIVGIVLVMKNLFSTDTGNWTSKEIGNSKVYYDANIKLLDEETKEYIVGAKMALKDKDGNVVEEWTTEKKEHTVIRLEKGTYTLEQTKGIDGYEVSDKVITIKISNKDRNVTMYNASKKEEVKETASEVGVDNTLSMRSSLTIVLASIVTLVGIIMVVFPNKKLGIINR